MKFKTNDGCLDVKFTYYTNSNGILCTRCDIIKYKDGMSFLYQGTTLKSFKDTHNKKIARKVALSRALREYSRDKQSRKEVWDMYLQTCKY